MTTSVAIGVYDLFSASIAANFSKTLFLSGFGLASSHLGLPDVGLIPGSLMVDYITRVRHILPDHDLIIDLDDGYGDAQTASSFAKMAESAGASILILEDQGRPKKCGHLIGKNIIPLEDYLAKLSRLKATVNIPVIARTDSESLRDAIARINAFIDAGADYVLIDGLNSFEQLQIAASSVPTHSLCINMIAGGKTEETTLSALQSINIKYLILSLPCLSAAQSAIHGYLSYLSSNDYSPLLTNDVASLQQINHLLNHNFEQF